MAKAKLCRHTTEGWFHISCSSKIAKRRQPDAATGRLALLPELSPQEFSDWATHSVCYGLAAAQSFLPADFPNICKLRVDRDAAEWGNALTYLNKNDPPADEKAPAPGKAKRVIPLTGLRRFYQFLRFLPAREIQEVICQQVKRKPEVLVRLITEASAHVEQYQNAEARFHPDRRNKWWPQYSDRPSQFAHWLTARLGAARPVGPVTVNKVQDLAFIPVDYEVSPLGTRGAVFEDGSPGTSSGSGGMDLLLCRHGIPVVGEIKAKTDVSMFVALIQALAYAVELSSKSQRQRLERTYKELTDIKRPVEIYLIYEESNEAPVLLQEAQEITDAVMKEATCSAILGQIAFLSCRVQNCEPIFTCAHLSKSEPDNQ